MCLNCCFPNPILDNPKYRIRGNEDLCEHRADYVFMAFLVTGVVLLILGACIQSGYIPLSGTAANYILGFGGGFFGLGGLLLLARGCCSQ